MLDMLRKRWTWIKINENYHNNLSFMLANQRPRNWLRVQLCVEVFGPVYDDGQVGSNQWYSSSNQPITGFRNAKLVNPIHRDVVCATCSLTTDLAPSSHWSLLSHPFMQISKILLRYQFINVGIGGGMGIAFI